MSKAKFGEELIPFFDKACAWYEKNKGANLPSPSCLVNPDSVDEIDPSSEEAGALFYTKSSCYSRLAEGCGLLSNFSTHIIPLFAGIQQMMTTEQLAQIIVHHNISVDDYEDMLLARQGDTRTLFNDVSGATVTLYDAGIESWKAFDTLGLIVGRNNAPTRSNYAAMHTQCVGAWPATILTEIAKGNLGDESGDSDLVMDSTAIVGEWGLSKASHFPENNACHFLRRSGMLVSAGYRKQLGFHHQWEELCLAVDEPGSHLALRLLLACRDLEPEERKAARNALRSMHPDRGDTNVDMQRVFQSIEIWFKGTDLDISDSTILKINLSGVRNDGSIQKHSMAIQPELYSDILKQPQHTLGKVCQEILAQRVDEIGYADLAVFRSLKKLQLGDQVIDGFRPEDVILKLEAALTDFMGKRTKPNKLSQRMYDGLSDAFELFGNHAWDYSALKGCSEQIVLTLVRGGAAMSKLPDMGRKRRGQFLEEELGL